MKTHAILFLVLLTLCGCSRQHAAGDVPSGAPAVVMRGNSECRRANDRVFSARDQQMIGVSRQYLEQEGKKPIDAYYHVEHRPGGYEVFVLYVSGYDGSQPTFLPGGFCTVVLGEDGAVIRVMPGT
jgi:hypothetical protein